MPWNFIWKHSFINQYPSKCKIMQILSHKKSMFETLIVMFFKLLQKNNNKRQQDEWHLEHKDYLHVQKKLLVTSCKESTCQCRRCKRHGFDPWVGKIPWWRKWHPLSSILACRIPWTEEPGRPQSIGSQRVGHNRGFSNM